MRLYGGIHLAGCAGGRLYTMGDSSSVAFSQTSFLASQATQWPFLYQPTLEATLFNVRAVVMTETAAAVLVGTAAPGGGGVVPCGC